MKSDGFDAIKDKYDPFLIQMTNPKDDWKLADMEMDPEEEASLKKMTAVGRCPS